MLRYFTLFLGFFVLTTNSNAQTSLQFDGVNDYVNLGNPPSLNITGTAITLEAWVYATSFTPNVWQGNIINKNGTGENGYMLRAGNNGQVNFNLGSGVWNELNTATGTISLNTWHHLAGTYDGVQMKIYVDGTLAASSPLTVSIAATTTNVLLGEDPQWVGRYFPGRIDEARIWNVARSQAEIQATMSDEMCTTHPNLKAYYRFNGGVAGGNNAGQITLVDESGNGNNGTLLNFANSGATSNWATGVTLGAGMTSTTTPVSACNTYTWAANGQTYTSSGTYSTALTGSTGCDSTSYLNLTVYSPNNLTSNVITCDQYVWGVTGQTYTTGGSYPTNQVTSQGCPYTHTLNLTLNQSYDSTEVVQECPPYVWPVNGVSYTTDGMYTQNYTTMNGCDSNFTLNLTFLSPLNATISMNANGSLSTSNFTTIQWVDCNDNYAPVTGATSPTFFPLWNGSYAVIVTDAASCPDTSDCFIVDYLGLESLSKSELRAVPNPTTDGSITVDFEGMDVREIRVLAADGKIIQILNDVPSNKATLQLPNASGVYFLRVIGSDDQSQTVRMVKN